MIHIENKNILLIAPRFFGYEIEIANELRQQGASVDLLPDRPFNSPLMKAITRIRRELILAYANSYYKAALRGFGRESYDLILIIQGEAISIELLKSMRIMYPKAQFVLYMWDSFKNKKALISNIKYFDKSFTFDWDDAKQYGMTFRPLFFINGFHGNSPFKNEYDVSFIGTAHSDRYRIVAALSQQLPTSIKFHKYLFLQAPWLFWLYKIFNSSFRSATISEFKFQALDALEVQRVFAVSRCVLDIEHPKQQGLTMRTLEALGSKKKFITTNKNIVNYDFFNEKNILVIDRNNIQPIPMSFFVEDFVDVPDEVISKYSIQGWIRDVIS